MSQTTEDPQTPLEPDPAAEAQSEPEPGSEPPALAPAPEPPATEPPATDPPAKPNRRARRPQTTNGHYMVIAAPAPTTRESVPSYREIGWFKAHGADHAKRQAVADAEAGHDPWLKRALHAEPGIILRAVPALNWPKAEPTRYKTTKTLEIG